MDVFRVLGNENRRSMLRLLMQKKMHISALAKELDISVPVALKHVQILEEAGFVERTKLGNTHVVSINSNALSKLKSVYSLFEKPLVVEARKATPLIDALKRVVRLSVEKTEEGAFISSVDGKRGYYIYEVNGKLSEKPVDKFLINRNAEVEFKRLVPVLGKKIVVRIRD
jgi:DNA-binding transcriptional ArsR family regulator